MGAEAFFLKVDFIFGCTGCPLLSAWAFSSCGSRGCSSLWRSGFLLLWLLLWSAGVRASVVAAHGFSCSVAYVIFSDQGSNLCPLHWQVDSFLCMYLFVCVHAKLLQSCPTLRSYGLQPPRLLCPWDFPGKNTGLGCHAFLREILPTQGSNPCLLRLWHQQMGLLPLVPPGKAVCAYKQQKFISHCCGGWRSTIRLRQVGGNRDVPGLRLFVRRLKEGPGAHLHGLPVTSTAQVRSPRARALSCVQCEGRFPL